MEMPFPPAKESFDVPAELVDKGDLLNGQVKPVGGDPVGSTVDLITNQPYRCFGLVDAGCAQKYLGIKKDWRSSHKGVFFKHLVARGLLDAADKMALLLLPMVKPLMRLVAAIHNGGLPGLDKLLDARTFRAFALGEYQFAWDAVVEIEPEVQLCLIRIGSIISPMHGKHRIDERAINHYQDHPGQNFGQGGAMRLFCAAP